MGRGPGVTEGKPRKERLGNHGGETLVKRLEGDLVRITTFWKEVVGGSKA